MNGPNPPALPTPGSPFADFATSDVQDIILGQLRRR